MLTYICNMYGIEQIQLKNEENLIKSDTLQVRNISDFLQTL